MGKLEGLKEYQENSKQLTIEKVDAALKNLKRGKKKITYKLVAKSAGVSEQTLYKSDVLKEKIKQAQAVQHHHLNIDDDAPAVKYVSEKDKKIQQLEAQIEKLKDDLEKQKNINELLTGNLEKKTSENLELKIRINTINKIKKP